MSRVKDPTPSSGPSICEIGVYDSRTKTSRSVMVTGLLGCSMESDWVRIEQSAICELDFKPHVSWSQLAFCSQETICDIDWPSSE